MKILLFCVIFPFLAGSVNADIIFFNKADEANGKILSMDAGDVITGPTEHTLGWYGQMWALTSFLRSHETYRQGLAHLLSDAEAGQFHKGINVSAEAIEKLQKQGRIYNRVLAKKIFEYYITNDLKVFEQQYFAFACELAGLKEPSYTIPLP